MNTFNTVWQQLDETDSYVEKHLVKPPIYGSFRIVSKI